MKPQAVLVLENGAIFSGYGFGALEAGLGEVCFNTSMSGYQEILTDPSYRRQIVTLTYPMIGNYGVQPEAAQSSRIQASGLIVKEYVHVPSNFASKGSLGDYMAAEKIPGIQGLDTRKLVLMIRNEGAMRGGIFPGTYQKEMLDRVKSIEDMNGLDLAREVTTSAPYKFGNHRDEKFSVAVMDFGVKLQILHLLDANGFNVTVFPAKTPYNEIKDYDCYFLSNGPGDPEPLDYAITAAKSMIAGGKPVFGICLGHQILGLAEGRKTYKLKFGHRGGNQPVRNVHNGRVEITSQNHGFAVEGGVNPKGFELSHVNLNDRTVEGFHDMRRRILSVQYHPEACPGPHDAEHLFKEFHNMVQETK